MGGTMLSRVIALVRVKYIAWLLGRSAAADAFNAAFQLPDMMLYFLVGGAATITFVTMLTRFRESGRDAEGERAMSVILTTMLLVLGSATIIAEIAAPLYVHWWFSGFQAEKAALCVHLTRILLPIDICFFAGSIFAAVLLTHRVFFTQAISPLLYNLSIIFCGAILAHVLGVSALAVGAVVGAVGGILILNGVGAHLVGMRYRPILDWSNPGMREWVRMSIPLMLGVSLVQADTWIINHFASRVGGAITLLAYAKLLFTAPVALGQAAGAASLPFLASLFAKPDLGPFARRVNSSVTQLIAFSVLLSAFMIAESMPIADALLRGGAFQRADSAVMAGYLGIFSISLCLWSAQALYARAFYAAGNTVTPMVASTIVTIVSIPVYSLLYRLRGPSGLAIASDVGITLQTITLAVLLHRRQMVSLAGLNYREIARSLLAAVIALIALLGLREVVHSTSRVWELAILAMATLVWIGLSAATLRLTGSALLSQLMSRFAKPA
jgi:putative peptidoglycan lipid II flippase